jgi:hypothetical protein
MCAANIVTAHCHFIHIGVSALKEPVRLPAMHALPSLSEILQPCQPCMEVGGDEKAAKEEAKAKKEAQAKREQGKKRRARFKKKCKKQAQQEHMEKNAGCQGQEEKDHLRLHVEKFKTIAAAGQKCSWCCWILHSRRWKE